MPARYTGATTRGQLTEAIRYEPAGTANAYKWQARGFTERYAVSGANYIVPAVEGTGLAGTWNYSYGYSTFDGSPTTITYPKAGDLATEAVTTVYDDALGLLGLPRALTTTHTDGTYVARQDYTKYGEPTLRKQQINSGVWVDALTEYDVATRRVTRTAVKTETSGSTVWDRSYTYDNAGNYTAITDTPEIGDADQQCFRQDALRRLVSAWTPGAGVDCAAPPSAANLGGPAPYWLSWEIDNIGNRLQETSYESGGITTRNYTVPASGANSVRPHAVTAVQTQTAGQAVTTSYTYDAAGNMTCRPTDTAANDCASGTNAQHLSWDAEGKLASVAGDSPGAGSNIYDADGTRLIRRDATGSTLYLPGQEVRQEGASVTGTRYYSFNGEVVASRDGLGLTWLFTDHQGTQSVSISALGQDVDVRRQTPYGGARGSQVAWPNSKGFVGGDNDPSGLVHIGAREYDSGVGRFVSVDPIQDLTDPQQWHGYAYANNNPVTFSDPSGLIYTDFLHGYDPHFQGFIKPKGSTRKLDNGEEVIDPCPTSPYTCQGRADAAKPLRWAVSIDWSEPNPSVFEEVALEALCVVTPGCSWAAGAYEAKTAIQDAWNGDYSGAAAAAAGAIPFCISICKKQVKKFASKFIKGCDKKKSFEGDTKVLMADGSTKKIEEIKIGDLVLATNPETGEEGPRKVTHLWVHQDQLVDLQVANGEVLTTTEDHPFWNEADQEWQESQQLDAGDLLHTATGQTVALTGLDWSTAQQAWAYNLTVDDIHTYYVLAGTTPVLVHNTHGCGPALTGVERYGAKWKKHSKDYGKNPGDAEAREWYKNRITEVRDSPDEVRRGHTTRTMVVAATTGSIVRAMIF